MKNMIKAAVPCLVAAGILCSTAPSALASGTDDSSAILSSLGNTQVESSQLAKLRGGALSVASVNIGTDSNNTANNSPTGTINNNQSVNNNTGLTTILQNTGNNALLQSSMTVNIVVH
ncbi:hypothetical protein [Acidocella aromatica]|uniref:Uncharacterized protein n=1 Tax=Acidocella aromatica TaxID=1303579 RepID=A0A840VAY0_9PROT|nr:hypothetical protein [Acidocella aromatica]MBB5371987.1 hypothetical protein [Acidocella aromatica]